MKIICSLHLSCPSRYSREIEMIGSYNQIEGFIFGRQSFGGFNPVVEYNVSRGIWKPCYLVDDTEDAVQDPDHNSDPEPEENDDEVDVPDKEMARTFGSLVGTLGKKFLRKRDRGGGNNKKGGHKGKGPSTSNHQLAKGDGGNDKRKRNKNKSPNKNKSEEQGTKNSEPLTIDLTNEEPPRKRSKFMKPSE